MNRFAISAGFQMPAWIARAALCLALFGVGVHSSEAPAEGGCGNLTSR